jgi:hypothetical protein
MAQAPFCPWEPPPGYQQQQPLGYQVPQYQPQPYYGPPPIEQIIRRECDLCGQYIKPGEDVVESYYGVEGQSEQSGQPIAVDPPGKQMMVTVVHRECHIEHAVDKNQDLADDLLGTMVEERALEMYQEAMDNPEGELARRLADENS